MKDRRLYRRRLTVATLAAALLVLAGCGPSASKTDCESTATGAKYTIEVKNGSSDKKYTVRLQVSKSNLDFSRDGDEKVLEPGETDTFKVNIKKGEKRYVGVVWPAPGGDDTYKYNQQLDGEC